MSTWLILAIGLQVFPKGQRPPLLLQTLESELLERINAACRSASTGPQQARDPLIAANLMLDANRQVAVHCCTHACNNMKLASGILWTCIAAKLTTSRWDAVASISCDPLPPEVCLLLLLLAFPAALSGS